MQIRLVNLTRETLAFGHEKELQSIPAVPVPVTKILFLFALGTI